jgi:phosphohistidine phosphatase
VRAADTAALACEALGIEPASTRRCAAASIATRALALLGAVGSDQRVLVVGHEPDFSQVVDDLTGARIDLKKGGVAAVRIDGTRRELIRAPAPA